MIWFIKFGTVGFLSEFYTECVVKSHGLLVKKVIGKRARVIMSLRESICLEIAP